MAQIFFLQPEATASLSLSLSLNFELFPVLLVSLPNVHVELNSFFPYIVFVACLDYSPLPEEMELTEQMNALGLPLSFHTNKEVGSPPCFSNQCLLQSMPSSQRGDKDVANGRAKIVAFHILCQKNAKAILDFTVLIRLPYLCD